LLKSENIGYIVSVTRSEGLPKFHSQDQVEVDVTAFEEQLVKKHIDINDDPTEDILCYLKDTCDRIESWLTTKQSPNGEEILDQAGVLVHSTQGISRSGSIIIAYCKSAPIF
jgi:dual specificity phosphatase 12